MAIVYQHRRKDNNQVFYVGIGLSEKRANEKYGRNNHWMNVANKYGHEIEITHKDVCWEEACSIEKYLICFYGRVDLNSGILTNMTDGGEGVINPIKTEAQKEKWRAKVKGVKKPILDPIKKKIASERTRERFLGKPIAKPRSEEYRNKMSKAKKGKKTKPLSEETKKKLSDLRKGKKKSFETRQKMKISNKRPHKEETKIKLSEIKKIRYYIDCLTGKKEYKSPFNVTHRKLVLNLESGIFYKDCREASDIYGYKYSTLKSMLNGYRKNKTNLIYT